MSLSGDSDMSLLASSILRQEDANMQFMLRLSSKINDILLRSHSTAYQETPVTNAMKHLQVRFTKFCKTSLLLRTILATIVVKFRLLKGVIALRY